MSLLARSLLSIFFCLFASAIALAQTEGIEAAKTLLKRGFSPVVAASLLGNSGHGSRAYALT